MGYKSADIAKASDSNGLRVFYGDIVGLLIVTHIVSFYVIDFVVMVWDVLDLPYK